MAIAKDIAVHGSSGTNNVLSYVTNEEKTNMNTCGYESNHINCDNLFSYAENLEKTSFVLDGDEEILISGYRCSPETASIEFQITRDRYMQHADPSGIQIHGTKTVSYKTKDGSTITKEVAKESIETHHIIQSFPEIPGLDPRLIHHLGLELVKRAFPDHKCVVATHMNTNHLHNHIIMCAYNEDSIGKYHSNKKNRKRYRSINDEISLEYGLPILLDNDLSHNSLSWIEWNARNKGESWKDTIRHDISLLSSLSSSWDDYISRMKSAGYKVRETDKYVTYTMAGSDTKKVRDKSLGAEFMRDKLKESWSISEPENSINNEPKEIGINNNPSSIPAAYVLRVSRYTESGRIRTDLEVILIKAIKLLKYFMDQFFDEDMYQKNPDNPIYLHADYKIKALEQALYACEQLGLENKTELNSALNNTGAKLSHYRKELEDIAESIEFYTQTCEKIDALMQLIPEIDRIVNISSYQLDDMYLSNYTDEQISNNIAQAIPMTGRQRQELYIKLQDSPYHLGCKFKQISYIQANNVLDYLNGKTDIKPSVLLSEDEYIQHRLTLKYEVVRSKYNQNLKRIYRGIPITNHLVNILTQLLVDKQICLKSDITSLDSYQAILLISHLSGNVYKGELISKEKQAILKNLLTQNNTTINRPIEYVLASEADELIAYLSTGVGSKPDLLKSSKAVSQSTIKQVEELLALKSESCTIPIKYLSSSEIQKLELYLLNKETTPETLLDADSLSRDEAFIKSLDCIDYKDRALIIRYRNILNDLKSYGFDIDILDTIRSDLEAQKKHYEETLDIVEELKGKYKNLSKLKYSLNLAQTAAFTHGPLHSSTNNIKVDSRTYESEDRTLSREDDKIQQNKTVHNKTHRNNSLFTGIEDDFFSRM